MNLRLIDLLIEAETQLDWGSDPDKIEKTLIHLREVEPEDDLAPRLKATLMAMKPQNAVGRVIEH